MAKTATLSSEDFIQSLLDEYAKQHGWSEEDYAVIVEPGRYGDIHVRFGAKALEQHRKPGALEEDVWEFLRSRLPRQVFGKISLFGGSGLSQFRRLYLGQTDESSAWRGKLFIVRKGDGKNLVSITLPQGTWNESQVAVYDGTGPHPPTGFPKPKLVDDLDAWFTQMAKKGFVFALSKT
jgi:hypothetical protein